jgi:Ca2+-binding RTX toxin-like protein
MATINGDNLSNVLIGTNQADTVRGLDGNDILFGLAGHDLLNGGAGADVMSGGPGNDLYIVDNPGDIVVESSGEGTDRVESSVSFSLNVPGALDVENLTLSGSAAINGLGNGLDNRIVGNDADNALLGRGGNDSLFGLGGHDFLEGGDGADTLNGGTGADIMRGEAGNDTYVVDDAGDTVVETPGAGLDKIVSSINFNLGFGGLANVENLTLVGAALNGTGNALSNTLIGNEAINSLAGLDGSDQLLGRGGDDVLDGGAGNDTLKSQPGAALTALSSTLRSVAAMSIISWTSIRPLTPSCLTTRCSLRWHRGPYRPTLSSLAPLPLTQPTASSTTPPAGRCSMTRMGRAAPRRSSSPR